jgi:hypothetical protein
MKLKLHGNSIRLRLTRREIAEFAQTGRLEETFACGSGRRFAYGIERSEAASAIGVRASEAGIYVVLPSALAAEWTGTDRVGVSGEVAFDDGQSVAVLAEKEFRRVHGANSDPDLYPNPLEQAEHETTPAAC